MSRRSALATALAVSLALACADDGTGPPPAVSSVTVVWPADTLLVGETIRVVASASDSEGNAIPDAVYSWTSSDTTVATVDGTGLVAGIGPGSATVTASSGGRSGSASLDVLLPRSSGLGRGSAAKHGCRTTEPAETFCWGYNYYGQLGRGSPTTEPPAGQLTAEAVSGGHAFVTIALGGAHTCGVTSRGTGYCWGHNSSNQLGIPWTDVTCGGSMCSDTPLLVPGDLTFVAVAAGASHTCGLTRQRAAYCWGYNASGQLGDGSTSDRATPARVSGL